MLESRSGRGDQELNPGRPAHRLVTILTELHRFCKLCKGMVACNPMVHYHVLKSSPLVLVLSLRN